MDIFREDGVFAERGWVKGGSPELVLDTPLSCPTLQARLYKLIPSIIQTKFIKNFQNCFVKGRKSYGQIHIILKSYYVR